MEHKVATLTGEKNDTLAYTAPLEVMSYDYKGPMYVVDSNQVSLKVTPNHRMWTGDRNGNNFKIMLAEEVCGKRRKYVKNVEHWTPPLENRPAEFSYLNEAGVECEEPQKFVIRDDVDGTLRMPMDAWLTFFGIWMAEGCTLRTWGVSFATHKQRVKDELERVSEELGFEIHKHKDDVKDEVRNAWCFNEKTLVNYFVPLSVGAINKSLPAWVWHLPKRQCRVLITGMMLGDGHTMENGTRRYYTSSAKLANDFQRLCLHAGFSGNSTVRIKAGTERVVKAEDRKGEIIKSTVDAWHITIVEKQNTPLVNKNIKADGTGGNDRMEEGFDGKVYCCRVNGTGVIYVRRNGLSVWCGQSRHAQKGTMGMILDPENMPQTASGIIPDIIINPHCIPSRMTIAHLMETLMGRICSESGALGDGSPFTDVSVEGLCKTLRDDLGLEPHSNEVLYCGTTGKQMATSIFMGPIFYQRLKHMVDDKQHSRSSGPLVMLTRQPAEGRARDGGLRFGEMERDCMISHGTTEFLKEIMMEKSDNFQCFVCKACGLIGQVNPKAGIFKCNSCENTTDFAQVRVPYAYKLFLQELESMSICSRIIVDSKLRDISHSDTDRNMTSAGTTIALNDTA
jgi:ribosomal protein L37AE/L43A